MHNFNLIFTRPQIYNNFSRTVKKRTSIDTSVYELISANRCVPYLDREFPFNLKVGKKFWLQRVTGVPHDDVIKWKHFPRYWPFVRGIHRSPMNYPHEGLWRGALINGWVNNDEAGDLRRHRAHYDVNVMQFGRTKSVSGTKTPSPQWKNCLCTLWPSFQSSLALFACIPNFGHAVILILNCLSIDKEEISVLFPR